MKSMMLFYRLIVICFFVNFLVQAATLRPINKKNNIVKITDENKNTRTYYHLEKGNEMVFSNLEEFVEDPNETYSVKVITRAKISPNSNSNKIFGIELNILEDGIERNKVLKYKKGVSTAKKSSKSGFNFTQAGFWFDELKNIKNSAILIKLIDGSPPVDVRVVINPINFRSSDNILYPVNTSWVANPSVCTGFQSRLIILSPPSAVRLDGIGATKSNGVAFASFEYSDSITSSYRAETT